MYYLLWALVGLEAFLFAYTMQFTQATLALGRELSETDSNTGFQDAVTPPWQTNLATITYISFIAIVAVMWWRNGWGSGLGALALILLASVPIKMALPSPEAPHFRHLIFRSMGNRYADFVKHGDAIRADAMKQLLTKAGVDFDQLN